MALLSGSTWRGLVFRSAWMAALAWLAALTALSGTGRAAEGSSQMEYEVKAAFLYNFAKFVQWPPEAMSGAPAVRLCVLGRDPFGGLLEAELSGKTLDEKPIEISRFADLKQLSACQIVFISASERSRAAAILDALSMRPILTVSEIDGFAEMGGMANFYIEDRRIRFEMNPKSAARAGLRISSQLLKLSRIVDTRLGGGAR